MLARPRGRQACPPRSFAAPSEENPVAPVPIIDRDRDGPPPSLEPLFRLLSGDLDRVNALIVDRMDSPVALIPQLAGHIVTAGGKRLRPMLTLGAARLCGYRGTRHHDLAAAVEFIHTATLLHDDVVDESALRRGLATANSVWGNKPSVLVGDFLFSRATAEERQFWRRTLETLDQHDDDLARAQALLERYGALTETVERARHYGSLAKDALGVFPDGPERRALVEAAQFAIERAY